MRNQLSGGLRRLYRFCADHRLRTFLDLFSKSRAVILRLIVQVISYLDKKILNVPWHLSPLVTEFASQISRGDLIEMAMGKRTLGDHQLHAHRIIKRSNPEPYGICTFWSFSSPEGESQGFIEHAEDPRIFTFQSSLWLYYQIYDHDQNDVCIYIFNPLRKITYELKIEGRPHGKNWVPFEFQGNLYIIYSYEPFRLYKVNSDQDWAFSTTLNLVEVGMNFIWRSGQSTNYRITENIGVIRGGSALVEYEPGVFLGFTHVNKGGIFEKSHQIGFIEVNMHSFEIQHLEVSKMRFNLLAAPYCVELVDYDRISVHYNCSIGSVINQNQPVVNKLSTFSISELRKFR